MSTQQDAWLTDAGEPDFERMFLLARPRLLAVARRLVRNEDDAEDVVQEAFLNGLRHRHRFEARAQATSWMYRIVTNTALMTLRTLRRKQAESLDALPDGVAEAEVHRHRSGAAQASEDPERALERARLCEVLVSALSTLPPLDQRIVELRLREGYSTREAAARVGLSSMAAKTRLHRARTRLSAALGALERAA